MRGRLRESDRIVSQPPSAAHHAAPVARAPPRPSSHTCDRVPETLKVKIDRVALNATTGREEIEGRDQERPEGPPLEGPRATRID